MNKENKKEKKKLDISVWVLFTATFLIIVFFLWYFFIYVKNNEQLQIQKNFRVLTQLGENFKNRYSSYSNVIKSTDMKSVLGMNEDDSLIAQLNESEKKEYIKKYFFGLEAVRWKFSYDNDYVYFGRSDNLISQPITYFEDNRKRVDTVNFRMSKSIFFQPLERKDVFDEIIIIREDLIKDSSIDKYELFYTTFPGDIEVKNLDSLIANKSGLSSGTIGDVNILGIDYKLFMTHIKLSNNKSYFVGGVINKDKYVKDTRAINFYIALLIVIIFFTFLLSVPLIKLKVMSENQKLKVSDLLLSTMSIVIGTSFILLILFSIINYTHGKDKINTSLKNLSHSINSKLINEIKNIDSTLDIYSDSLISRKQFHLNAKTYNYFKLIFKLKPDGLQDNIITSRNKPSTVDNYSYRTYFKESGEWNLDGKKLMLDFIISSTSGEQLGVVSIKKGDSVYVITSRFYSVINTILPPGYGFCVIDGKGDVKFHSDPNRMLTENFIEETENSAELKGAIYGRLTDFYTVKYLGKNHSCYISPISTLPLHLVTFFDNSYSNSVNLQITSLTILFLFLILLLFFATVIGARLIIYRKSDLKRNLDADGGQLPGPKRIFGRGCRDTPFGVVLGQQPGHRVQAMVIHTFHCLGHPAMEHAVAGFADLSKGHLHRQVMVKPVARPGQWLDQAQPL